MLIFFDLTGNKTPEATKSSSSLRNRSRKKILARVTLVLWFKRITDYQKKLLPVLEPDRRNLHGLPAWSDPG